MTAAPTIPIVFPIQSDPVALGFADSLAHPNRNVTGFTLFEPTMASKWLELLREIVPKLIQVVVLIDPQNASGDLYVRAIEAAASALGIQLSIARARNDIEIQQAIDKLAVELYGGLVVPPGPGIENRRELIFELSTRHRLPAIYPFRYIAKEGGLMSYGPDALDLFRRSASYVDAHPQGR